VCDLETSGIGATYIYDISNIRVNSTLLVRLTVERFKELSKEARCNKENIKDIKERRGSVKPTKFLAS
jgi:hypothetical protein